MMVSLRAQGGQQRLAVFAHLAQAAVKALGDEAGGA